LASQGRIIRIEPYINSLPIFSKRRTLALIFAFNWSGELLLPGGTLELASNSRFSRIVRGAGAPRSRKTPSITAFDSYDFTLVGKLDIFSSIF
jgi:hypothetical protein